MKKKDIWISVAIIVAASLVFYFHSLRKQQQGYIRIDGPGAELQLGSGLFGTTRITSGLEPVAVRARGYRPKRLSIAMKENGNTWRIESRGPWGNLSKIEVKHDETTVLKLGPPLSIKPIVHQSGSRASIDFSMVGQAGEHYSASVAKNGRTLASPGLKIVDEAGKVLTSGKFEYG